MSFILLEVNLQRSLGVRHKILALMELNKESNSSQQVIIAKLDREIKTEELKKVSLIHEDELRDSKLHQKNVSSTDSVPGDDDDHETIKSKFSKTSLFFNKRILLDALSFQI